MEYGKIVSSENNTRKEDKMENRIRVIRAERKITQGELARRSGISRSTLNMIENGKVVPDGKTIAKLVSALGVPANLIFFDLNVV